MYQSGFRKAEPAGPYIEIYDKEFTYGIVGADWASPKWVGLNREGKILGRLSARLKLSSADSQERTEWNSTKLTQIILDNLFT